MEANSDESNWIGAMTDAGEYFCGGNDHANSANITDIKALAAEGTVRLACVANKHQAYFCKKFSLNIYISHLFIK